MVKNVSRMIGLLGMAAALAGTACSGDTQYEYPTKAPGTGGQYQSSAKKQDSLLGPDGLGIFGSSKKDEPGAGGIGVNSFLWRASLDSISFMPVASADAFGGVIITDWYAPPTTNGAERFKINVLIKDQRLRSDGVKVSVFRQERAGAEWRDTAANAAAGTELENAILTRARQMWLDANAAP